MTKHKNDPTKDSAEEGQPDKTASAKESELVDDNVDTAESDDLQRIEDHSPEHDESVLNELKADLETAKNKADENWDLYLRANADLENARRRAQQDIEKARKYGLEKLVEDLLPIKDSIEMGLVAAQTDNANIEKLQEGSELILKMFSDTLEKHGIEALEPKGESFNPERHQAMSLQESDDDEPNTVISVMQKGYLLNGRLIRPAMVIVAKKPTDNKQTSETNDDEAVGTNVDEKA